MRWGKVGRFGELSQWVGHEGEVYLHCTVFLVTSLKPGTPAKCSPRDVC
jgi:hypothetical protein